MNSGHHRAESTDTQTIGYSATEQCSFVADALKSFDEVFVIPACFLRIHLVSLHTSVDHFEWISEESGHKTA